MSVLSRSITMVALTAALGASALSAQDAHRNENFRWSFGGQAGVLIYKTPTQSRGGQPMAGVNMLIKARRTGLLLAIDEVIGKDQTSSFSSSAAAGGTETVSFNDIRRYSATLVAYPFRSPVQPYIGLGFGILHVVNPQPVTNTSDAERSYAATAGSTGFGSLVGGIEFHLGGIMAFGQYQVTTAPRNQTVRGPSPAFATIASGHLIDGPTHSLAGGLRISFGSARESNGDY
ncbi:MAG: hypothetical protein H0U85_04750 [Gemmatimonadales bacterium]|nr:hypothetical protein [Gemmatimonadales bacterium]